MTMFPGIKESEVKPKKMGEMMAKASEGHRPSLYLPYSAIPAAKDWEVGKEYVIALKVKLTGKSERREGEGNADFEILKVGTKTEEKK